MTQRNQMKMRSAQGARPARMKSGVSVSLAWGRFRERGSAKCRVQFLPRTKGLVS